MAKIWPVYEGKHPTRGGPWAEISLLEAISLFELKPGDLVSPYQVTPRFGDMDHDYWFRGYKHIVVEFSENELQRSNLSNWKSGFYRSGVKPKDAIDRLVGQGFREELGKQNVVRVDVEPTSDSQGDDALKITVVVAPKAVRKLASAVPLDALARLRTRLREMGDTRTPIVHYATESELAQHARD